LILISTHTKVKTVFLSARHQAFRYSTQGNFLVAFIYPILTPLQWVGETEKLVRSVFKLARRLKPCVVFIDEIDALLGSRTSASENNNARWHTSMLTEFMQEMDGLVATSVILIGATNRPFDIDDAVLRRLPCRLLIDLPGEREREAILKIMLKDDELAPDVNLSTLAKKTDRFSGSDLKRKLMSVSYLLSCSLTRPF
jgi:SpoVK/Ycf46/Vps4 family AAA+-type ATPase